MHGAGHILSNGSFLHDFWSRLSAPSVECVLWRQTFAADRWKIRYAQPDGAAVFQARSQRVPEGFCSDTSLEIQGREGVTQDVFLGQRIEASEATRYRRRLRFSAWIYFENTGADRCPVQLVLGTAKEPDVFGNAFNDNVKTEIAELLGHVPAGRWVCLECEIDAQRFSPNGLSVELQFPAASLNKTGAKIYISDVKLFDASQAAQSIAFPVAWEALLNRRFFQRHDLNSIQSLGRALYLNPNEIFFLFTFPEMRIPPECTLPQDDAHLSVFNVEGGRQSGFVFNSIDRSRRSVIIRATKQNHGLPDATLSFVGPNAAILLDAEL